MPREGEKKPGPAKGSKAASPVTQAERDRVRELHAEGKSRNAIARELGRAVATITKICRDEGLSFDRSATAQAVEARRLDLAAERARIIERLYRRVGRVLDRLDADKYLTKQVTGFGEIVTITEKMAPAQDERNYASAISGYLNTAVKLAQVDQGDGSAVARSMLGDLARALEVAADQLPAPSE